MQRVNSIFPFYLKEGKKRLSELNSEQRNEIRWLNFSNLLQSLEKSLNEKKYLDCKKLILDYERYQNQNYPGYNSHKNS